MEEQTKEKLCKIDELYPSSRIEKSKQRFRDVWEKKAPTDRAPYTCYSPLFQAYDPCFSPQENLQKCLDEIILRAEVEDDYIPSLFPGCRTSTIPSMFGCKEVIMKDDVSCEKLLERVEDIDNMPDYSYPKNSVAQMWLDVQEHWLIETQGKIPIHCVDMQGPMDVVGTMIGYDKMFLAAYDDPDRYHTLMSRVTSAFIDFWKKQKALLGKNFVGTHLFAWDWYPENVGATMSCDSLVMVSPDFYDDFYRQYIEQISKEFGGVVVHSCGNFSQVVKNLCSTNGLKAINSSQMSISELMEAGMTNDIIPIVMCDYNELNTIVDLSLKCDLHCYITTMGQFPSDDIYERKPKALWTPNDYLQIKQSEQAVLKQLKRFAKKI